MPPADQPAQPTTRVRRADAERNRNAIIKAAGAVFAEQGGAVDVREIARRSGVGMGTLYRHFPTKDDLLVTVLEQEFTSWLATAEQAEAKTEDPWQALTDFFEQTLAHLARNRALVESYADASGPSPSCVRRQADIIESLRRRCLAAGRLRPDVTTADLTLLIASLSQTVRSTDASHPGHWRRLLRISLDGLGSHNTGPLPDPASAPAASTETAPTG
ncbi:TetR/AcrR family transcriptional regulator [Streptomyces sp. NPDC026672]|uniref:TetR/AcrR family transcriptional regulator n=1 Tax=unclassified Streptomyces TaxID=2593676 RepID=UPI0033DEFC5F